MLLRSCVKTKIIFRETMEASFVDIHKTLEAIAGKFDVDLDTKKQLPLPAGKQYHFFISHFQATGGASIVLPFIIKMLNPQLAHYRLLV